ELSGVVTRMRLIGEIMEERAKLGEIVGHSSDGIATVLQDRTIESWNPAMARITGYEAESMVGSRHLEVLRTKDEGNADVHLERWYELDKLPETVQILTLSGEVRWLSCAYS